MNYSIDAGIAVVLLSLLAVAGALAFEASVSSTASSLRLASEERIALAESEFALTHCAPKGVAKCAGEKVLVNEVVVQALSLEESARKKSKAICVRRLVLAHGSAGVLEFCAGEEK